MGVGWEDSQSVGFGDRLPSSIDVQLPVDVMGVLLDGALGDDQLGGDLFVAELLSQET